MSKKPEIMQVTWSDTVGVPQGEFSQADITEKRITSEAVAVGYVMSDTDEEIVLAQVQKIGGTFSGIIVIPKSSVLLMSVVTIESTRLARPAPA